MERQSPRPFHAHVYYDGDESMAAQQLRVGLLRAMASGELPGVLYVGAMRDRAVGPHPKPQFEIHAREAALPALLPLIESSGLTALIHPLTDDDLADHTTLARWIGAPLPLDCSVLDPPGCNQGVARFGRADM